MTINVCWLNTSGSKVVIFLQDSPPCDRIPGAECHRKAGTNRHRPGAHKSAQRSWKWMNIFRWKWEIYSTKPIWIPINMPNCWETDHSPVDSGGTVIKPTYLLANYIQAACCLGVPFSFWHCVARNCLISWTFWLPRVKWVGKLKPASEQWWKMCINSYIIFRRIWYILDIYLYYI